MTLAFTLSAIADSGRQVTPVKLPPKALSVLTQVRKTVHVRDDLLPSILARGQQTPGAAAALVETEARIYLEQVNRIFDTNHNFSSLTPVVLDGEVYYLPLIAGHRRHATCLLLNEEIAHGRAEHTPHFDGLYRVDLHFGISALDAIEYQFNENRHVQVPAHEEAEAAWRFWRYRKNLDPGLTSSKFAKSIGRTNDWVRNALRFCNLPTDIQSFVMGDGVLGIKLPYGILVDLARLADGYESIVGEAFSHEAYHRWIRKAVIGRLNGTQFATLVSGYLDEKRAEKAGQGSLFNLSPVDDATSSRRTRRVVAENTVRGLWTIRDYLSTVERLWNAGLFGEDSYLVAQEGEIPFSPASPIRLLSAIIDHAERLAPHLASLAKSERTGRHRQLTAAQETLPKVQGVLKILLSDEEDAGPPS